MKTVQQYYSDSYDGGGSSDKNFSLTFPEGLQTYKFTANATNVIDVLPFKIVGDAHPLVKAKRVPGDGTEYDDIFMYWEHRFFNDNGDSVICLNKTYGKPCPICEERKRIAEMSAQGWKDERVKKLAPKSRVLMNVIDWKDRAKGIQVFAGSAYIDRNGMLEGSKVNREDSFDANVEFANESQTFKIVVKDWKTKQEIETEHVYFQSPTNGFGIAVTAVNDTFTSSDGNVSEFVKPTGFSLKKRTQQYTNEIADKTYNLPDLLNVKTYNEVMEIFCGVPAEDELGMDYAVPSAMDRQEAKVAVAPPKQTAPVEAVQPIKTVAAQVDNPELHGAVCTFGKKLGLDWEQFDECSTCVDTNPQQYGKCAKAKKNIDTL